MTYIIDFIEGFPTAFEDFCEAYFAKIIACIVVVLLFLAIKFIVVALAKRIVRNICAKKDANPERVEAMAKIVVPPLRILVITAALAVCTMILDLPQGAHELCMRVVNSLLLISLFSALYGLSGYAKYLVHKLYEQSHVAPYNLAANYIGAILKTLVFTVGFLTVIQQWVSNISTLLAGLSIGGIAIALAAQNTAENFFGSLTVIFDHPFEIGDYIEIGSVTGTVEKMGFRSTKIRRSDQALVIMPNAKMTNEHIVNWTTISKRRVDAVLGILYNTPTEKILLFKQEIEQILLQTELIENDSFYILFDTFSDSSLDISLRYYVLSPSYRDMCNKKDEINIKILDAARRIGIGFAYPSRSIYIENNT
ncbi:MAG: mechanosensitive ion channel family protein [Clostridia bacterium]|nr:mechanosensitive ion channel family protein [Clostridia bacterium]